MWTQVSGDGREGVLDVAQLGMAYAVRSDHFRGQIAQPRKCLAHEGLMGGLDVVDDSDEVGVGVDDSILEIALR